MFLLVEYFIYTYIDTWFLKFLSYVSLEREGIVIGQEIPV